MDNVCHTLAGAALGESGLKGTTRFGTTTLIIAANLPDVDVLAFATDVPWVAVRRGWTHGVLAQAILPVLLAGIMYGIGRVGRGAAVGERYFRRLLLLSFVGVLSHVGLDLLNNYGVRLLMPFSARWFYGDSVFIVDPWLWGMLGASVWLAFTRDQIRPARILLIVAAAYILAMVGSARLARDIVREDWRARNGREPRALMVGPMPLTPFSKVVVVDAGQEYVTGGFSWLSRAVTYDGAVPKNDAHRSVRAAIGADSRIRAVLTWARFPYYEVESRAEGDVVILRDLRFREAVGEVRSLVRAPLDRGASKGYSASPEDVYTRQQKGSAAGHTGSARAADARHRRHDAWVSGDGAGPADLARRPPNRSRLAVSRAAPHGRSRLGAIGVGGLR